MVNDLSHSREAYVCGLEPEGVCCEERVPCGRVTPGEAGKEAGPCLGGRSMHSGLLVLLLPPVFLDSHRSPASDSAAQVRGLSRFPHSSFGRKPLMP